MLQHLFVNVGQVDWQLSQRDVSGPSLVETLWGPLEAEIRSADLEGRRQLLGLLARVAYFQLDRVVRIARWLIDNPLDDADEPEEPRGWHRATYQGVLYLLPDMLKAVARYAEGRGVHP